MTTWQHSVPSNQTTPTHQHNSQVEDSPSDLPRLLVEETLEFQVEYPREVAEEAAEEEEEFPPQYQRNKQLPVGETSLLAIHHSYLQVTARNQKHS